MPVSTKPLYALPSRSCMGSAMSLAGKGGNPGVSWSLRLLSCPSSYSKAGRSAGERKVSVSPETGGSRGGDGGDVIIGAGVCYERGGGDYDVDREARVLKFKKKTVEMVRNYSERE
ncbi:hypothetical protein CUMW_271010 [Citrus unshiu]|uniref:Uncharacterized protein n=1 Tax=Citrus unshiu TaxID=55188 RepID=A0A2H5QXH7_CITUN|nr:hypothetical protein CUMW_271010 [Citrus unshiu]